MRGMGRFLRNGASVAARPERRQNQGREALSPPILPKMPAGGRNKFDSGKRFRLARTVKSRRGQDFTPYWRSSRHRFSK